MQQSPYPAIHTVANARAGALEGEVAALRAEADALLAAIDELCGEPPAGVGRPAARRRLGRTGVAA